MTDYITYQNNIKDTEVNLTRAARITIGSLADMGYISQEDADDLKARVIVSVIYPGFFGKLINRIFGKDAKDSDTYLVVSYIAGRKEKEDDDTTSTKS